MTTQQFCDLTMRVNQRTLWRLKEYCKRNSLEVETYPERDIPQVEFRLGKGVSWRPPRIDYVVIPNCSLEHVAELRKQTYGVILAAKTAVPSRSCAPWSKQEFRESSQNERI